MAETLAQTFARYSADAEFREWNHDRKPSCQFVYVHHDEEIWKFTFEEWWKFVSSTIRNRGAYRLPLSKHLRNGRKKSMDPAGAVRTVNLRRWTMAETATSSPRSAWNAVTVTPCRRNASTDSAASAAEVR